MKTRLTKLLTLLLAVIIFTLALPLSASADYGSGYENLTAAIMVTELNRTNTDGTAYIGFGPGTAELVSESNTVKLLKNIDDVFQLWIYSLAEDIVFDLNGHTISNSSTISLDDDNFNTFTFKDSVGTGKIINTFIEATVTFNGGINVVFEGGNYIGTNASEYTSSESVAWIDIATPSLSTASDMDGQDISLTINGGTFIGGNGLDRKDLGIDFIEHSASAISLGYEDTSVNIKTFEVSKKAIIKGGNGDKDSNGGHGIAFFGNITGNTLNINDAQISGGNGKIGGDAIYSVGKISAKITDATLKGGTTGGKEINVADGSSVEIINTKPNFPTNTDKQTETNKKEESLKSPKTGDKTYILVVTMLFALMICLFTSKKLLIIK